MTVVADTLLDVRNLTVDLGTEDGTVRPVDNVSFSVAPGEILGLVGESGCGKTMAALSLMRLLPTASQTSGQVLLEGRDLLQLSEKDMQHTRGHVFSMIFQEPMTSLDPVFTIGHQVTEAVRAHRRIGREDAKELAIEMLTQVGIARPQERLSDYPHQLSGGMRQRVMIAIALILEPKLLIADEPTTALDVTIQAQILDLIKDLQHRFDMGVLLISHDLAVVGEVADRVAVMYSGEIVEIIGADSLFHAPRHPYTQGLLRCIPGMASAESYLNVIDGRVPDLRYLPPACRFAPRCPHVIERCWQDRPQLENVADDQYVSCWNPQPFVL
jgi:oligopeptide/dipeptide ABC transporter ATP-binding protein